jgi:hypothetical protein
MHIRENAVRGAAREKMTRKDMGSAFKFLNTKSQVLAAALFLPLLLAPASAQAGLLQRSDVPLKQFGFATIGRVDTKDDFIAFYDATRRVLGPGAIVRTNLGWDPNLRSMPNFAAWSDKVLEPALAKGITILPSLKTMKLDGWGNRIPTDAQWTTGLRMIVRMYGPNGIYQTGGSYQSDGRTVRVETHPGFSG